MWGRVRGMRYLCRVLAYDAGRDDENGAGGKNCQTRLKLLDRFDMDHSD